MIESDSAFVASFAVEKYSSEDQHEYIVTGHKTQN